MRADQKNFLLSISLLVVLILALYLIFSTITNPYIGLNVEKNESGEWQISEIDKISWAANQGIGVGDIVTQVNRHPPGDHPTIKKFYAIENIETLELNRNAEKIEYHVSKGLISEQLIYYIVVPTFFFIVLLNFSYFLYIKKRDDKSSILLIFFFLAIGFSYLSAGASAGGDTIAKLINAFGFLFTPLFFLHFLYSYFTQFNIRIFSQHVLPIIYGFNGLFIFVNFLFIIGEFGFFYPVIRSSKLVLFFLGIVICLYVLISRYIGYRKTIHNPVLKTMILGVLLSFLPYIGFVIFPKIILGEEWMPGPLAAAFLMFLPIVYIYLITAKRLLDIDFIINRIRYFCIMAFFPSTVIFLLIIHLKNDGSWERWGETFFVLYLIIIVFMFTKEKYSSYFQSKLIKERNYFQASLDRFFHDLAKVMKVSDLEERFITEIESVLGIKTVSLLEMDEKDLSVRLKRGHSNFLANLIMDHCKKHSPLISIGELNDIDNGVFLIVGKNKNKHILVWICDKMNRTQLNRDERAWLTSLGHYISLVYENLNFIEGLTDALEEVTSIQNTSPPWILRFIFSLSEKERRRLALDLHDSALQDQLFWYRKLESIIIDNKMQEDIRIELNYVKEGLLDVIEQIRETCNELLPPFLKEIGIIEILEDLFIQTQLRSDYVVNFDKSGFDAVLDHDYVLSLYRIVQELLRNASRHSNASRVDITLSCTNDKIYFHYRDNGVGMDLLRYQSSFKQMGLHGIKERITSLEGESRFQSTPGNGFEVSIWMPITINQMISEKGEEEPRD